MFPAIMNSGSPLETAFWMCAVGGTLFFVLKALLSVFTGIDGGVDVHHEFDTTDVSHGSDVAFKFFSLSSLTGFFMMFGWIGLAALVQYDTGEFVAMAAALSAGLVAMVMTSYLFKLSGKLVSQGDVFDVTSTVGLKATVYELIPATGLGRIQLVCNGMTRELEACSEQKKEIGSHKNVEIIRVIDGQTVSVRETV